MQCALTTLNIKKLQFISGMSNLQHQSPSSLYLNIFSHILISHTKSVKNSKRDLIYLNKLNT